MGFNSGFKGLIYAFVCAIVCTNESVEMMNLESKICEGVACNREANASQLLRCVYIP